eukprot:TRINITY_DN8066_c0_g3_i1.p2 TRINITY_DN8066_c0_g3~~TRINITY_DN8066_c0_g3_i1.p2  ORF type:complete len:141 (-),score=18.22 TRINITY_DN8066_c0_g3_i1:224-646(-)
MSEVENLSAEELVAIRKEYNAKMKVINTALKEIIEPRIANLRTVYPNMTYNNAKYMAQKLPRAKELEIERRQLYYEYCKYDSYWKKLDEEQHGSVDGFFLHVNVLRLDLASSYTDDEISLGELKELFVAGVAELAASRQY